MRIVTYLGLLAVLIITIFFRSHVIYNIAIDNFITAPLLYADLLGKGLIIPWRIIFLLDLCNIFLFFLIGKELRGNNFGLLVALLYGILPWMAYIQLFGSLNIFILFFLLAFFYGALILKEKKLGLLILVVSSVILLFSTLYSWFVLPVLIFGIYKANLIKIAYLKAYILIIAITLLPVLALSLNNTVGLKNIYQNKVGIFKEPGLKNSINALRGESQDAGYSYFAKLSENKYFYLSSYFILKSFKHIMPSTYFTSQEKLLNFSFSPPIYVGFLIPFIYGFYLVLRSKVLLSYLPLLILIVPSLLSKQLVDLDRLVIFSPVIVLLIGFGLVKLYIGIFNLSRRKISLLVLSMSVFLVLVQFAVTISDISLRESLRYKQSINQTIIFR